MANKPQWQIVLEYMKTYGSIDAVEAFGMNILRLSNQIRILEKKKYAIKHGTMDGNRVGKYTLMYDQPIVQRVAAPILPPAFKIIDKDKQTKLL